MAAHPRGRRSHPVRQTLTSLMKIFSFLNFKWSNEVTFFYLCRRHVQQFSYLKQLSTLYYSGSHTSNKLIQIPLFVSPHSSSSSPIHHTHKNTIRFPVPAAHETMPLPTPAHCGGKKMFSNILHLPLFISILCRMSLTACKLIYNAVCSSGGWRMGGTWWMLLGVWKNGWRFWV